MSDWQVGDLALCVDDGPCKCCGTPVTIVSGRLYRVAQIFVTDKNRRRLLSTYLRLEGNCAATQEHPLAAGHRDVRFRKIRPDEHTDCEPEFIELLKRSKQRVSA